MRRYIIMGFKDQMGLQWKVEFRETGDPETDAAVRVRVHKLGDRIAESADVKRHGKGINSKPNPRGRKKHLGAGLEPGLNLLWGFPNDSVDNLWLAVEFLRKYDPCDELRTIRPVTPYPGKPLFDLAVKDHLISGVEDFYERAHVNSDLFSVQFMDMPSELAHEYLFRANKKLVENYLEKRGARQIDAAARMYLKGDTSFRGFRDV